MHAQHPLTKTCLSNLVRHWLHSPMSGQPDTLCHCQWCHSSPYKSMNRKKDFKNHNLRWKNYSVVLISLFQSKMQVKCTEEFLHSDTVKVIMRPCWQQLCYNQTDNSTCRCIALPAEVDRLTVHRSMWLIVVFFRVRSRAPFISTVWLFLFQNAAPLAAHNILYKRYHMNRIELPYCFSYM